MIDPAWERARKVLAVRLDNLGDVLVTTPAIHAIRRSLPRASLTLLASPVGAQAGRLNPDIDDVIVYQAPWMDPWRQLPQESAREQRMIAALKEQHFDGAVIFSSYHQSPLPSAYLCYLADIPLRLAASIDGPGSLLTTRHKHPQRLLHEVERGLDLVGALGLTTSERDLVLAVPDEARQRLHERLAGVRRPLVVLHPGCSMPARTYPWEEYAEVADRLIVRLGATVALTGTEPERELVARVRGRMRYGGDALDFSGALDFPEFCALVEAADLTITNNTGPMHVAAAVKTPVVALFALTNPPEQWGPWRVPHRLLYHEVPCRLCYQRVCPYGHECLTLVTPELVVEAAAELLALTPGPSPNAGRGEVADEYDVPHPKGPNPHPVILSTVEGSVLSQHPTYSMGSSPLPRIGRGDGGEGSPYLRARNILAVRLDNLGDVVMLGPALRAVKETSPEARLTLLASPGGAPAAALLPWVDEVISWRALWQDLGQLPFDPARERELLARLAAGGFDAALIFTSFSQSPQVPGYACYLAGIPLRAGESAEFGGRALSDELRGLTPEGAHQVERNLKLVEALGFPVRERQLAVAIPDAARAAAARLLAGAGLDPAHPYVLLHPGASAAARRYPPERFGLVARELQRQGWPVLVCGVEREAALLAAVRAEAPRAAFLAGQTTLPEYAALVERAALVICNNSLPLHLADATGTPLVALYSGTDRESEWGPRAVPARLLRRPTACAPCRLFDCPIGLPCLDIPPEEVARAALALLETAALARVGAV